MQEQGTHESAPVLPSQWGRPVHTLPERPQPEEPDSTCNLVWMPSALDSALPHVVPLKDVAAHVSRDAVPEYRRRADKILSIKSRKSMQREPTAPTRLLSSRFACAYCISGPLLESIVFCLCNPFVTHEPCRIQNGSCGRQLPWIKASYQYLYSSATGLASTLRRRAKRGRACTVFMPGSP